MIHLRYDIMGAHYDAGEERHPEVVLRELGITFENSIPQSMGDQWWLFNCKFDRELPKYITEMKADTWMVGNYKLPENYING